MPYTHFHERFPKIAARETRSFTMQYPGLSDDEFGLFELYCDEPGCDCRRVMFSVVSRRKQKAAAVIAYGWESEEFYVNWFGDDDQEIIAELQGPVLNSMSPQTDIAPLLLTAVKEILQDEAYVARLKRHYALFRKTVTGETAVPPRKRRSSQKGRPSKKRRSSRKRRRGWK